LVGLVRLGVLAVALEERVEHPHLLLIVLQLVAVAALAVVIQTAALVELDLLVI
jgi:hypothetical protein